jgi:hypothetical protein
VCVCVCVCAHVCVRVHVFVCVCVCVCVLRPFGEVTETQSLQYGGGDVPVLYFLLRFS